MEGPKLRILRIMNLETKAKYYRPKDTSSISNKTVKVRP
jgi:hypothetical protein